MGMTSTQFQLKSDSYEQEPIPDLEGGNGSTTASSSDQPALAVSSSSPSTTEHTVINRMTTMEYFWRSQVRSRTSNATVQAMLDRLLLVFLFLASLAEKPLTYLLGNHNRPKNSTNNHSSRSIFMNVTQGTVKTNLGVIAYRISQGRNPKKCPILCFHSERRSSDEFLEILPLLADTGRRVVAIDIPGFGWSENPRKATCTIDMIADAVLKIADSMLIEQFVCLGHFFGTTIATSLASRFPNRVKGVILVNVLYNNIVAPIASKEGAPEDNFVFHEDGSHLIDLHNKRKLLDPTLSLRCMQVDLANLIKQRERHLYKIEIEDAANYDLESSARKLRCPALCLSGELALSTLDGRGLGGTQRFDTACRMLAHSEIRSFSGPTSTAYMMNQAPREVTSLCASFLEKNNL